MTILFNAVSGSTLLIPSTPSYRERVFHLYILLTNSINYENHVKVLLVNVTSIYPGIPYDSSCILHVGDHPYIKHDSYILYGKARIEKLNEMMKKISAGIFIPKPPIKKLVLDRICLGLERSLHSPPRVKNFYSMSQAEMINLGVIK